MKANTQHDDVVSETPQLTQTPEYQTPRIEAVYSAEDLEREAMYAGPGSVIPVM